MQVVERWMRSSAWRVPASRHQSGDGAALIGRVGACGDKAAMESIFSLL